VVTGYSLKNMIEILKKTNNNEKVVLVAHSMGVNVVQFFLKWAEAKSGNYREYALPINKVVMEVQIG
jgi:esterase/lipase superfamily enzyme